jgi:type I restriction enzyme, S subunit
MTAAIPTRIASERDLPQGWRWRKLCEVARIVGGTTPASGIESYWNGDIIWVTPTDLGKMKGRHISDSERLISKAGYENCGTELVPPESVVLSSRAPIGHLGIAAVPLCTNQGCKSLVPTSELDSNFLYLALKRAVPILQALGSGATFKEVSKTQLENFEIPLPPLSEQKRIAAILYDQTAAIDRARDAAHARFDAARALPAAFLHEVFAGPTAQPWPLMNIGEMASLVTDGPHVTPSYQRDGIPFLTVRNIVNRRIDLTNVSYISPADHALFSRRAKAQQGDILYTKDGTLGVPCLVDTDEEFSFFVSVALIKLKRDRAYPPFVACALESPSAIAQVKHLGAGAGLKHMVIQSIRALRIPLPSLSEQKRIADLLVSKRTAADGVAALIHQELADIDALPFVFLRSAFRGEL